MLSYLKKRKEVSIFFGCENKKLEKDLSLKGEKVKYCICIWIKVE